jgi:hypothetical protein
MVVSTTAGVLRHTAGPLQGSGEKVASLTRIMIVTSAEEGNTDRDTDNVHEESPIHKRLTAVGLGECRSAVRIPLGLGDRATV